MKKNLCFVMLLLSTVALAQNSQNENVFQQLKQLESQVQLPISEKTTLNVVTYNASTGKCTGLVTRKVEPEIEINPTTGKPMPRPNGDEPIIIVAKANIEPSLKVDLVFKFTNLAQNAVLKVSGKTYQIPAQSPSYIVTIDGKNGKRTITYSIASGAKSYTDEFQLTQTIQNLAGAGVFSIAYLPVGIIYQPVLDIEKKNFATYGKTTGVGATMSFSLTNDQSTTKAIISPLENVKSKLGKVSDLLIKSGNPKAVALGSFLKTYKTILDGLGSYNGTKENGTSTSQTTTFGFQNTQSESITTQGSAGPGKDDIICFRKNVKFIWYHEAGQLYIVPISDEGKECLRAETLQSQIATMQGDKKEYLTTLLNLDPLTNTNPTLSSNRYTKIETITINGLTYNYEISNTEFSSQSNTTSTYTFKTENYKKGWLSFFGLGTTEDKTVKTNITQSKNTTTSTSNTVSASFQLHAQANELYTVEVYYDNLFNTFLLRKPTANLQVVTQGVLTNAKNEFVTIKVGNETYKTKTDANGNYKICSDKAVKGKATLFVKGQSQMLDINTSIPLKNSKK